MSYLIRKVEDSLGDVLAGEAILLVAHGWAGPALPAIARRLRHDIAGYVQSVKHPDNRGGWGIGNIGPIPEGMIAWLLAAVVLVGVARLIGERASS